MERCIRDAIFHLDSAKQALEASLTDPDAWSRDSDDQNQIISKLLPLMVMLSASLPQTHNHSGPEPVESLQAEPGECQ